jgi:hypothetical protein
MLFLFSMSWGAVSGWWSPVGLLLGILYAWLMYRQPVNITRGLRKVLFALRALVVAVIALLLLSPLVRSVNYQQQKPLVLIAQDKSSSINTFHPAGFNARQLVNDLSALKNALGDDYEVREFSFDHNLSSGLSDRFNGKQTNISSALHQLNERFVNQNIGAIILATDGLYNQGSDPQYEARNIKTSLYTVALGDTIPRRDLLITNVSYNKTAFLGNDFELEVLTQAYQSKGEPMRLTITENGRQVHAQTLQISNNSFRRVFPLKLHAGTKGIRKFVISIAPVANEVSVQNNSEAIYIEVLDARQKILLLYNSPHPDISAIKQSIEHNRNFEIKTLQLADLPTVKPADYSLLILYQLAAGSAVPLNTFISKSKTPVWYILGAQTGIQGFNNEQKLVQINTARPDMQEVFAQPATDFSAFTLTDSTRAKLNSMPPLMAPFGNYGTAPAAQVLFRQKIGSVATTYPLLLFGEENGRRTAVLTGEGIWRWQLAEYQAYGSHHALEELSGQSVQYLTANAARQRFRVYAAKNVFDEGEHVLLNAELYNKALELVNTPDVKIELKNSAGKAYSYLFSRNGQSYQLNAGTLPNGEYTYTANTALGKQLFNAKGQLTVKALNLESRQSTADHGLLYQLARQSGGQMLQPSEVSKLAALIRKNENIKTVVYEDKRYNDLIDVKWVFALILALLSSEWFLRKREGEI